MKRTFSVIGGLGGLLFAACAVSACSSNNSNTSTDAGSDATGSGSSSGSSSGSTSSSGGSSSGSTSSSGTTEAGTADAGTAEAGTPVNVATWTATCNGTTPTVPVGNWFAGADSYQGTSTISSPCSGAAGTMCPPTPMTCSAGGPTDAGGDSIHLTGMKVKGSVYVGFNFGSAPTPVGSTGISFWYMSTGAAFGGALQVDLGLVEDILVGDWQDPGPGTCLAPNYNYGTNQCWNNPLKDIPAAAGWTQITLKWTDFTVIPFGTTAPAWWAPDQAALDQHVVFVRIGVLGDTDRLSDAGTAIAQGTVDAWISGVTLTH